MRKFSYTITFDGQSLEFVFHRIYTKNGEKFFVTVIRQRQLYSFDVMQGKFGKWEVKPTAPAWILEIQQELITALEQYLNNDDEIER